MDHISGVQTNVSRSDRRYGDDDVKKALGVGDFPLELTRSRVVKKEVPAVPFHSMLPQSVFQCKIQKNIYKNENSALYRLGAGTACGANMSYWPQLNFAVWYATTGCGISREVLDKASIRFQNRSSRF